MPHAVSDILLWLGKNELIPILGAVIGSYVSIKVAIGKLEAKTEGLSKDIDNIALILGTRRAIAEQEIKNNKNGDQNAGN